MDHRHYLTEQAGHDPGAEEAVIDYAATYGTPRARRLLQKWKDSEQERQFLRWSQLNLSRPGASSHLTDPDDYAVMRRHGISTTIAIISGRSGGATFRRRQRQAGMIASFYRWSRR